MNRSWALVLRVGVVAVGAGLIASSGVPLYDGVGFPDEPYRYVHPPAGQTATSPPASLQSTLRFSDGFSAEYKDFATSEVGPQIDVYVQAKTLTVDGPTTVGVISVTLTPLAVVNPPASGAPDSNIYRIGLTAPGAVVDVAAGGPVAQTAMRSARATAVPVMDFRAGASGAWQQLKTYRLGQDIFGAHFVGAGDYLLVEPSTGPGGGHPAKARPTGGLPIAVIVVLGVVLLVLIVRVRARTPKP